MAVGIVLHHIAEKVVWDVPNTGEFYQFLFWGAPIVAIFFFLSGYGLMKSLLVKGVAYLDGFLRKRMTKIVLPLVLCSLVYSVVNICILGGQFSSIKTDWPFLPNAWFCVTISIYYLVFYALALCTKQKLFQLLVCMWIFTLGYILCLKMIGFGKWWFQSVISLNMGMTIALFETDIRKILDRHFYLILFPLFLIVCLLSLWAHRSNVNSPCCWLTLSLFIGALIYCLSCGCHLPTTKALSFLGKYSYEIYLVHGAIISVVFVGLYTCLSDWWGVMMMFTLLSTLVFAWILKRVMLIIQNRTNGILQ